MAHVDVARENAMVLDDSGNPHISFSYNDGNGEDLYYANRVDGVWSATAVETYGSVGMENDIAIDDNYYHIVHRKWINSNDGTLLYSTNDETETSPVEIGASAWTGSSIALDSNGFVHIAYVNSSWQFLYSTNVSGDFKNKVIDAETGSESPKLMVDRDDFIHVVYKSYGRCRYATNKSGSWRIYTVDIVECSRYLDAAMDSNGFLHISYLDSVNKALKYATNRPNGNWVYYTVDSSNEYELGYSNSIAIGPDDRVHILYRSHADGNAKLMYATASTEDLGSENRKLFIFDDFAWYPFAGVWAGAQSLDLDLYSDENPFEGAYALKITTDCDTGITELYSDDLDDWNKIAKDFDGVTSVSFSAKGGSGGETLTLDFLDGKHSVDLTLTSEWQKYTVDLSSISNDLEQIFRPLNIVIPGDQGQIEVFLDEIYFEVNMPQWTASRSFPSVVKGVGYNEENPLRIDTDFDFIRNQLDANAVRFWSVQDYTHNTLDSASGNDLKTILGFWLPRGDDNLYADYSDYTLKASLRRSIRNWLKFYYPHRSIIAAVLGNEVFLFLSPSTSGNKTAFSQFLDDMAEEIHFLCPDLKVTYATAGTTGLAYLQANTPNLDIYSSNSYAGGISDTISNAMASGYGKPLLFLEYGCYGWWSKDWADYPDEERAADYVRSWEHITSNECLGGCAFAWKDKSEGGYVGWGLVTPGNDGGQYSIEPKPQCDCVAEAYSKCSLLDGPSSSFTCNGEVFNLKLNGKTIRNTKTTEQFPSFQLYYDAFQTAYDEAETDDTVQIISDSSDNILYFDENKSVLIEGSHLDRHFNNLLNDSEGPARMCSELRISKGTAILNGIAIGQNQ